jgi:hypothetical protein
VEPWYDLGFGLVGGAGWPTARTVDVILTTMAGASGGLADRAITSDLLARYITV